MKEFVNDCRRDQTQAGTGGMDTEGVGWELPEERMAREHLMDLVLELVAKLPTELRMTVLGLRS